MERNEARVASSKLRLMSYIYATALPLINSSTSTSCAVRPYGKIASGPWALKSVKGDWNRRSASIAPFLVSS